MMQDKQVNFLDKLNKTKSFANRIKLANTYLPKIGSGSGRIVYDFGEGMVLKLAKNTKGVAQNNIESDIGRYGDIQDIVANIIDYADDNTWVVSEKAKRVSEKRINEITGIPGLDYLCIYLNNFERENRNQQLQYHLEPKMKELLDNNEFVIGLTNLMGNYNISSGDLCRPSSYGEVLRNGKPAIVVTDYGLNDEVYGTYYNPQRKEKYKIYELYQYADGNDDILSQANGEEDIRKSMWALIPDSVGGNNGDINEKFTHFILSWDKHPSKPLKNIPVLTEYFYECVGNLKEVLNTVPDKKKFYENLLEFQEYLVEQGFYNRDKLENKAVEIDENGSKVGAVPLNREYATQIASNIAKKMGLGGFKYLGGEGNGVAFLLDDGKVLKITTDISEADAGLKISMNRNNLKTIGAVYKVYEVQDTVQNNIVYALIEEYIGGQNSSEFHRLYNIPEKIRNGLSGDLMYLLVKRKTSSTSPIQGGLEVYPKIAQEILDGNPEANVSKEDRKKAYDFMMGLYEIKKELIQLGIKSNDFNNFNNLGYKNGVLTYFDVGGYFVSEPVFDSSDIILIPENFHNIGENYSIDIANSIVKQIASKLGVKKIKPIGSGMFGVAYDIGNNKILKITSDESEAIENLKLIGKPLKYIAQPYNIFRVTSKNGKIPETYAIVLEKLEVNSTIKKLNDRLNFAFGKILNLEIPDVIEHYLGDWENPKVNEDMVNSYLNKNPKDANYFNGLLNIAQEARKYGVQSMDYLNWKNIGYKKNGVFAFFDVGFGDTSTQFKDVTDMEIDEDSTSLYSTISTVGSDDYPTYNQDNLPPTISNDLSANSALYGEGKKSYMHGAMKVMVKDKCKLGGLGSTSNACNQGGINNLIFKPIDENSNINEIKLSSLQNLPFKDEVTKYGGKIYSVGGAVRDKVLGMESKDLDILISGIPMNELEKILSKYGQVNLVGKSYGILKFKFQNSDEEIDIAIPRTEKPTGEGGHKGFEIISNPNIPIEKDLQRRDFTINAIAMDADGNIVDPYGGIGDIQKKIIRVVNPMAFSDDPLRMLRAVQFASRFGFKIESKTMKMIQNNAKRIKEISPERILAEFSKIVERGNKFMGALLLKETGLLSEIFGTDGDITMNENLWKNVKTMGEFIFMLSFELIDNPADFYKNNLKGDINTYKEIKALQLAFGFENIDNPVVARSVAHNMYIIFPKSLYSQILPDAIKIAAQELLGGKFPKSIGELAIDGNDLIQMGLKGKEIGNMLKSLLIEIYSNKVKNSKNELLLQVQEKIK